MNLKVAISSICISLVFLTTNAYSGIPESQLLFSITSQNTIRLGVINTSKQDLDLEIVNKTGNVFLDKKTKSGSNYFQLLDVNNLPDGNYVIHLSGRNLDIEKKFIIENRKIKLKINFKPKFNFIDNETLLVFLNNPERKNIDIAFENNKEVIFEDKNVNEALLNKRYSLKKMPKGYFTIKLWVDDELYQYSIEVK
jgi:hypothetical protein